jgi:hypothetical protein
LKSKQYLFIERLLESSTTEEWIQISEGYTECNEWEELGKEHRAKKNFALANSMKVEAVTTSMIEKTSLGVDGWATVSINMPLRSAGSGTKGAKGKPPDTSAGPLDDTPPRATGKGKAGNKRKDDDVVPPAQKQPNKKPKVSPIVAAEKDVKQFIADEAFVAREVSKLKEEQTKHPAIWTWANSFFKELEVQEKAMDAALHSLGTFPGDLKAAQMTPANLRNFKKNLGETYLENLVVMNRAMKDTIPIMKATVDKIKAMGSACLSGEPGSGKKIKTKA